MDEALLDGRRFGERNPCFGCSPYNPNGLQLSFEKIEGGVRTEFQPRLEHQGPPGLVHGGLLMTLADEAGAWVVIAETGKFGFTTSFEGKILGGAKVERPLVAIARCERANRRVMAVTVDIEQDGKTIVQAQFRFALLNRAGAEDLLGRALPEEWQTYVRD